MRSPLDVAHSLVLVLVVVLVSVLVGVHVHVRVRDDRTAERMAHHASRM